MYTKDEREIEKLKRDKVKADKKGNLKEVASLANYLGELLAKNGLFEEAKSEHEQELAISEALNDSIGAAVACRKIGENYCDLQNYEKALHFQQRHLNLAKKCDNLIEEQRAWATIGRTYFIQSENMNNKEGCNAVLQKALDAFQKSLQVCEELKKKGEVKEVEYFEMKARLYLNIGLVHDVLGDTKECADNLKRAITLAERHHFHSDLYRCQTCLAAMYQRKGNLSQALRFLEAAQKIAVKLKDRQLECETLTTKALISCQIGDFSGSKHALKKAYKLSPRAEAENLRRLFCSVSKLEEATVSLEAAPSTPCEDRLRLFESLGDCSAEAGNFKQAIDYYLKMLQCATDLSKPTKDFIPIYVSVAQTYADDKQYKNAIKYYMKEMEARGDDDVQVCKTLLNIAEIQFSDGEGYDDISKTYLSAYKHAKKAKHHLLEFLVLKALTDVQKNFNQKSHLQQTTGKLNKIKEKYDISSSDELSDDERDSQRTTAEEEELSISELSESEDSDEELPVNTNTVTTGRARRNKAATKRNEKGETPLHRACIEGNLKKVERLIEQGHQVNPRDYCGWIPLHEAANHDHYEIVQYLLEHGAAVNDRGFCIFGGVHFLLLMCANCGNMEILELLISKGANVLAKDDEGNTALDCLRAWRQRCDNITDDLIAKFTSLEQKLQKRLPNLDAPSIQEERQNIPLSQTAGSMPLLRQPKRKSNGSSMRRTLSSGSESDYEIQEAESLDSTEDSQDAYPNPLLQKEKPPKRATEFYKSAIKGVGLSATKMVSVSQPSNSKPQKEIQPFLAEEEILDDDWLIDDMKPTNRKRRLDVNDIFPKSQVPSSQRGPKRKKHSNEQAQLSDFLDNENIESDALVVAENPSQDNHIAINETTTGNDLFLISENESSNDSVEIRPRSSRLSRKPKQTKLTNFGVRKSNNYISDENLMENTTSIQDSRFPTDVSSSVRSGVPVPGYGLTLPSSQLAPGLLSQSVAFPVGTLRVTVKDKKLLVPVFEKDVNSTVSWLAEETASRYYKLTGLQCVLSIQLGDGAVLSPDDPVTLLLSSNEEIKGVVESLDLAPMSQQYEQACQELSCISYRNIKTLLIQSDSNGGKLDFQNLALRPIQLKPVFKAIQFQSSITEICLKANRLGDKGLEDFVVVLKSLSNLCTLDLSCNGITSVGLKTLADCVSSMKDETNAPKNLLHLSLSNNLLGDNCCALLNTVISSLSSLETLELSSCGFTTKLFQQNRLSLVDTVKNSSIHTLDVSCNTLGSLGVELVLCCLNPSNLTTLNLTGTVTASGVLHLFLHHIEMFLSQDSCSLADLTLSSCQLSLEEKDKLVRLLAVGKNINRLDISCNPKLTNEVVTALLSESTKHSSPLEVLITEGCTITSPINSDFLDALGEKLDSARPLTYLSMSSDLLEKLDIECLTEVWTQYWQTGVGVVKNVLDVIELCVDDK
ncbi:LOW QUALITY PROTEIN: tonsoku-like protein [Saccostrea cucullata]|uniref:LOW QUALITY PROTEIN: tonsoku-like protein n=1 Tax=Saccostrea cuccullata TaxID=36930 RepID=UPI002ED1A09F